MNFIELQSILPGMRSWGTKCGKFHFIITYEDGSTLKPEDKAQWIGYTASYKSQNTPVVRIDGLWQSFAAAENACKVAWRQLKRSN